MRLLRQRVLDLWYDVQRWVSRKLFFLSGWVVGGDAEGVPFQEWQYDLIMWCDLEDFQPFEPSREELETILSQHKADRVAHMKIMTELDAGDGYPDEWKREYREHVEEVTRNHK